LVFLTATKKSYASKLEICFMVHILILRPWTWEILLVMIFFLIFGEVWLFSNSLQQKEETFPNERVSSF